MNETTRPAATSGGTRVGEAIEDSPLIALGAGIAAGALLAALVPTFRRERELLAPVGDRIGEVARDAADAARKAGSDKLKELGLTPDVLVDKAGEAAKATAQAAVSTFRSDGSED